MNYVEVGVRLLVIDISQLSTIIIFFCLCRTWRLYIPIIMLCLGFIDHEIVLNGLLSFKLLKTSDGVGGLICRFFQNLFFSGSFLLIKFANAVVISSSLNPCPFTVSSIYINGLASLECSTLLFPIFVN